MKKFLIKISLFILIFTITLILQNKTVEATEYMWPIGGDNSYETYTEYNYYGNGYSLPIKNGKTGREYIVDNAKWPLEKYYYATNESHYGMDITGIYKHTYSIVSVVDGTVIATSGTRLYNPSTNYIDRNQRRTLGGLTDGGGYGNYIIIQETSTGRCLLYAHLKAGSLMVTKGDTVSKGQEIATMGSSGDSGHTHLHFEIRINKNATFTEDSYGRHFLSTTRNNTNLDPADYIGTVPNTHKPIIDTKIAKLSDDEISLFIKYLYRTALKRTNVNEVESYWVNKYKSNGSISEIIQGIVFSTEFTQKNGNLNNLDFSKKMYELILFRGNNYTEQEMYGHVTNLNKGIWNRTDYITLLANCNEFTQSKLQKILDYEKNKERKIPGIATENKLTKIGDLNADGCIDEIDVKLCLRLCLYSSLDPELFENYLYTIKYADVDGDGELTIFDASYIQKNYININ